VDPLSPTFDVIGFLGSDLGLAVAARNSIRVLEATGRMGNPVPAALPSRRTFLRRLGEGLRRRAPPPRPGGTEAQGRVNLFQMNPLEVATFLPDWRDAADRSVRNVCVPYWELPVVPRSWHAVLRGMDAVMAPSGAGDPLPSDRLPP
jgi:hypothetical protein